MQRLLSVLATRHGSCSFPGAPTFRTAPNPAEAVPEKRSFHADLMPVDTAGIAQYGHVMSSPVSSIRNLGPAFEAACARAGIHTAEELRDLGADETYARLLKTGTKPHFIGYYVLVMGLQGRPWNDCKGKEKDTLRKKFDALKAKTKPNPLAGIEAELDKIGVRAKTC